MNCVDLHTHSIYSDGTATPDELIQMGTACGLQAMALTDHDTMDGVREFTRSGRDRGMKTISGIEVSSLHHGHSLHILGYGIDTENKPLADWLIKLQQGRTERNSKILEKLIGMGINISPEEVAHLSQCGQTGRPHIARLLLEKGYVTTMNQAFTHYLGKNKAAWCSRFVYSGAETIDIIHQAGGVAVLAHPCGMDPSMKTQPQIIRELKERNLDGLEIEYPSHSRKGKKRLRELAAQYDLLATGGSDYHGTNRKGKLAGCGGSICPPETIMADLADRIADVRRKPQLI